MSALRKCFNCNEYVDDHMSKNCPQKQRLTRCPSCQRANKHAQWCRNTEFISREVNPDHEVTNARILLKFRLLFVTEVAIQATEGPQILGPMPKLFIPKNILILNENDCIALHAFPTTGGAGDPWIYNDEVKVLFHDKDGFYYGHLFKGDQFVQVNNSIRILPSGEILQDNFPKIHSDCPIEIEFKKSPIIRGVGLKIEIYGRTFQLMLKEGQKPTILE